MRRPRPVVLANQIRLHRSQHKGAFLVVEGRDDRLAYRDHIRSDLCKIIVAENKRNVEKVVQILEEDNFLGVLGIVDADFDRIEDRILDSPNVISPDGHDLETMLIRSAAFESVLAEFGSENKISKLSLGIREILLKAASKIGKLRLCSERKSMNLKFSGMNYNSFVDRESLGVDARALVVEILNRSQRQDINAQETVHEIDSFDDASVDPWELCTGADVLGVLSIGLRRALGSNSSNEVGDKKLRRSLRLAFSKSELQKTHLWRASKEWEKENAEFEIFSL